MTILVRFVMFTVLMLSISLVASAQDFSDLPESEGTITAINCDLANEPFALLEDGTIMALAEYLSSTDMSFFDHCEEPDADATYSVSINPGTNIRDAATTQSNIVARGQSGAVYEVYSETEGDRYTWLEIRIDGQPAYVAEQLTSRLPDVFLEENGDGHLLDEIPCIVAHSSRRDSRTSLQAVEYGQNRADFSVTRLSDQANMRLLRSNFDANTNGTYFRFGWQSAGSYSLQIDYAGESEAVGFVIDGTKTHFLKLNCE